ncbi:hypothetical protein J5N97_028234 [Dioscorea zingiberensis]|uniref:Longin domain-containing protein n=1 Tax=Dioscorea zingiberensis TaxID=325984 RepID=A0A9D5BY52_9LILI|nr:hypothetical protein J5N97_028234 [Dioscorea zingiberensis]
MSPESAAYPVLYACVAHGPTVLADHLFLHDPDPDFDDPDLLSTAHLCVAAAPRHHRVYTHTARGRIHAFLMADPDPLLFFFAIANESLGPPQALLLLNRLRHAFSSNLLTAPFDPPAPHCLQDQFLPVLHGLLSSPAPSPSEEKPSLPPLSPPLSPPPPEPSPVEERNENENEGKEKKKKHKPKKKKSLVSAENRTTIFVSDDEIGDENACLSFPSVKQARRAWERLVRVVLLVDLLICTFLFAIWLLVCRGFKCLAA